MFSSLILAKLLLRDFSLFHVDDATTCALCVSMGKLKHATFFYSLYDNEKEFLFGELVKCSHRSWGYAEGFIGR